MADIIKFVLPKAEPAPKRGVMTDDEFDARMNRIAATAAGAIAAIQTSLEEAPWSSEHADDLSTLSHELGNLFQVAANLIAARAALKD